MKMKIDDSAIIGAIKSATSPIKFNDLVQKLGIDGADWRQLDRQLQRLKRAGIIRYRGFESGALAGWVLTSRAAESEGAS